MTFVTLSQLCTKCYYHTACQAVLNKAVHMESVDNSSNVIHTVVSQCKQYTITNRAECCHACLNISL
jgi:hypothetical protein